MEPEKFTKEEISEALESLVFLVEKHDGRIKAGGCLGGSKQCEKYSKDYVA